MTATPEFHLRNTDYRYGYVCPRCAGPKTLQAAKCAACHTDDMRERYGKKGRRDSVR